MIVSSLIGVCGIEYSSWDYYVIIGGGFFFSGGEGGFEILYFSSILLFGGDYSMISSKSYFYLFKAPSLFYFFKN